MVCPRCVALSAVYHSKVLDGPCQLHRTSCLPLAHATRYVARYVPRMPVRCTSLRGHMRWFAYMRACVCACVHLPPFRLAHLAYCCRIAAALLLGTGSHHTCTHPHLMALWISASTYEPGGVCLRVYNLQAMLDICPRHQCFVACHAVLLLLPQSLCTVYLQIFTPHSAFFRVLSQ